MPTRRIRIRLADVPEGSPVAGFSGHARELTRSEPIVRRTADVSNGYVACSPQRWSAYMLAIRNVLVGTDFSECAGVALMYGRAIARQFGARLHVVHAVEPVMMADVGIVGLNFRLD